MFSIQDVRKTKRCLPLLLLASVELWTAQANAAVPAGPGSIVIAPPAPAAGAPNLSVTSYGALSNGTNTTAAQTTNANTLAAAISAAESQGAAVLTMPAGTYYFNGHGIPGFNGLHDFTFEGNGATLIVSTPEDSPSYGWPSLNITHCTRCVFQHFQVDWDWAAAPLAYAATVTQVIDNNNFDVTLPDTPGASAPPTFNAFDTYPISWNGQHYAVAQGGDVYRSYTATRTSAAGTSPPTYRVSFPSYWYSPTVGQTLCMRRYDYQHHGVTYDNLHNVTFNGISVYSCAGMAFLGGEDSDHWQLTECKVTPNPAFPKRPLTSAGDACHIAKSQGYFRLTNCDFGYQGDDCVNLQDSSSQGVAVTGANTLTALNSPYWQSPYAAGDSVELRNPDLSPTGFTSTLTGAAYNGNGSYSLTFTQNLPANLSSNVILVNHRYNTSHYIISGCRFHDNRARGLLIQGSYGLVENNTFSRNEDEAMRICTDVPEGFAPHDVTIQDNVFDSPQVNSGGQGNAVYMGTGVNTSYAIFQNILFQNNSFTNFAGTRTSLNSGSNVTEQGSTSAIPDGVYSIFAATTGNVLDCYGAWSSNGTIIDLWTYSGNNNQRWSIYNLGNGYYSINTINPDGTVGRSLDCTGASANDGTQIELWDDNGNSNQQWAITPFGANYEISTAGTKADGSHDVLDGYGCSGAVGTSIDLWSWGGGDCQQLWQVR